MTYKKNSVALSKEHDSICTYLLADATLRAAGVHCIRVGDEYKSWRELYAPVQVGEI